MSESKIHIKIGIAEFSGEGNQDWVSSQLEKFLEKVPELLRIELTSNPFGENAAKNGGKEDQSGHESSANAPDNLPKFLKAKDATSSNVRKFLATAAFLQLNGKNRIKTGDVASTLREANQNRLVNPSDSLNKNVEKGHCEKDGSSGFFVTTHGFEELNIK
ncbi:hypothetical protein [Puia dinghuensis]|uniref:Uncharacterized protein n=1 Tax=Puia dinghuensis TaxID=1792502 RepID=A0A8J2UAA2_9BACT|nr:hypothetical protein [Puia dinghuensis]GGA90179.1 hypothetical protein GCM10011511_11790 [Puia dinghuensis]